MLLYVWEEHVRMMEAMFLLWHEHRNIIYRYKPVAAEQLAEERSTWDYFPINLDENWLANPYLIVQKFFEKYYLAVYRDYLYEWLHMALTRTENRDPDLDAEEVITVYENMLELHAAAWIICQRNSDRPHLKRKKADTPVPLEIPEPVTSEPLEHLNIAEQMREVSENKCKLFIPLYSKPSSACALGLKKVKEDILTKYPTVQLIVYLGSQPDPFTCFLLVLISEEEKKEEGQLSNQIEEYLKPLVHTHIILHKTTSALTALHKGSRFWNDALTKGEVIYKSETLPSFKAHPVAYQVRQERAQFHWKLWGKQGKELLHGVGFFQESGNYRQAAFLLHKATETTLKGIIQAVLGYRIQMHNISRLLRLTLLFTDILKDVFELNTEAGVQEFTFLKSNYAQAHYSDSFAPESSVIAALLSKVRQLHEQAQAVYDAHLQRLYTGR
ncbi:HEPN domain-containing protein [Mucilaginibacter sp. CSA2-8R]|uniref:HEPN domain-containing protein n=1 Tax=Mucilaginibacter sp. CSA2-8R TaxID=3141542 RepID=UPI00315D1423